MKKINIKSSLIVLLVIFGFSGFLKEFLIIFLSITLHEICHLLAIKLYKGSINLFELNLTGARLDVNLDSISSKLSKIIIDISRNYYKLFNNYSKSFD